MPKYSVKNFCPSEFKVTRAEAEFLKTVPNPVKNLFRGFRQNKDHWALVNKVKEGTCPSDGYLTVAGKTRSDLHAACVAALMNQLQDTPRGFIPDDMQDIAVLAQVIYDLACPKEISDFKLNQVAEYARWFMKFAMNPENLPTIRTGYQEAIAQRDAAVAPAAVEAPAEESVEERIAAAVRIAVEEEQTRAAAAEAERIAALEARIAALELDASFEAQRTIAAVNTAVSEVQTHAAAQIEAANQRTSHAVLFAQQTFAAAVTVVGGMPPCCCGGY